MLQHVSYGYDDNRNVKSRTDHAQSLNEVYTYDALDRLRAVDLEGEKEPTALFSYDYDDLGNLTYKSDVGSYGYNPLDKPHAVRTAGSATYEYDANGNQLTRPLVGGTATLWYTPFDKLRSVSGPQGTTAFAYDGDRQRVRKTTQSTCVRRPAKKTWRSCGSRRLTWTCSRRRSSRPCTGSRTGSSSFIPGSRGPR